MWWANTCKATSTMAPISGARATGPAIEAIRTKSTTKNGNSTRRLISRCGARWLIASRSFIGWTMVAEPVGRSSRHPPISRLISLPCRAWATDWPAASNSFSRAWRSATSSTRASPTPSASAQRVSIAACGMTRSNTAIANSGSSMPNRLMITDARTSWTRSDFCPRSALARWRISTPAAACGDRGCAAGLPEPALGPSPVPLEKSAVGPCVSLAPCRPGAGRTTTMVPDASSASWAGLTWA